jgi:hypothetical protein
MNGGGAARASRREPVRFAVLCNCPCHVACPITGDATTPLERWKQACTCPGSAAWREKEPIRAAELEDQKRRMQEALKAADIRLGDSPKVIQGKLQAAAATHDVWSGSDFSRASRFLAAARARRGTRTVRLLAETASGLRAARRRGPAPAPGTVNAGELKRMRRTLAGIWTAAMTFALLSKTFTGPRRLVCAAAAGVLGAVGAAFGFLTYALSSLLRTNTETLGGQRNQPPEPPA